MRSSSSPTSSTWSASWPMLHAPLESLVQTQSTALAVAPSERFMHARVCDGNFNCNLMIVAFLNSELGYLPPQPS